MDREKFIKELSTIVDTKNIISDSSRFQTYGFFREKIPKLVVVPQNKEEVQAIVRSATKYECPLYPVGGGTRINEVLISASDGIGVCLAQMKNIIEFEPDNLSLVAEPGVTNPDLQQLVRPRNLFLPFYSDYSESTIGGEVASNLNTRKRYRYGSAADCVLGVEFVSPRGDIVKTGGKTVKNVSGYDLNRLLAGSWGAIGLITSVTVKLKPLPDEERVLLIGCDSYKRATDAAFKVLKNELNIAALEILYPGKDWDIFDGCVDTVLLVSVEGSNTIVNDHAKKLIALLGDYEIKHVKGEDVASFWDGHHINRRQLSSKGSALVKFDKRNIEDILSGFTGFRDDVTISDLDVVAGVLEFSCGPDCEELPKSIRDYWIQLQQKIKKGLMLSFATIDRNLLLEKLMSNIDPHSIMFPANRLLGGVKNV